MSIHDVFRFLCDERKRKKASRAVEIGLIIGIVLGAIVILGATIWLTR